MRNEGPPSQQPKPTEPKVVASEDMAGIESTIKEYLANEIGQDTFDAWFTGLQLVRITEGTAYFTVATEFLVQKINKQYEDKLLLATQEADLSVIEVNVSPRLLKAPPPAKAAAEIRARIPTPNISIKTLNKDSSEEDILEAARIVVGTVSSKLHISESAIFSRARDQATTTARYISMYLFRKIHPKVSYEKTGEAFDRSHATVINAEEEITGQLNYNTNSKLSTQIREILEELKQSR